MENEKILISGNPIEIADHGDHRVATFMISVLDEYDLNGRMITKESGELYHSTMVGMPILAKMVCNEDGEPVDFAGHEMYALYDEDGNLQIRFNTHPIGSVTETWIEERSVAGFAEPKFCIMLRAILWSARYPEYFQILDKLWAANNVKSSWELTVSEAIKTAKGRILKTFSFIGNTLLGSNVRGAVPGAGVCEYAEADPDLELASALSNDLCHAQGAKREEDEIVENELTVSTEEVLPVEETVQEAEVVEPVVEAEPVVEQAEEPAVEQVEQAEGVVAETPAEPEVSMLTEYDLRRRVQEAYRNYADKWCWVCFWFPANNEAWLEYEGRETELDYMRVLYDVDEEIVTITEATPVRLTVSAAEINETLAGRDNAILQANQTINELNEQIASLQPYKDAADEAERQRMEAEIAEKREAFRKKMLDTKLFTQEEIAQSAELQAMIAELNDAAFKAEVAERFIAHMSAEPAGDVQTEVSSVESPAAVPAVEAERIDVASHGIDNETFIRMLLNRN